MSTSTHRQRYYLQAEDNEEFCGHEMRPFVALFGGTDERTSFSLPPAVTAMGQVGTPPNLEAAGNWSNIGKFFARLRH